MAWFQIVKNHGSVNTRISFQGPWASRRQEYLGVLLHEVEVPEHLPVDLHTMTDCHQELLRHYREVLADVNA